MDKEKQTNIIMDFGGETAYKIAGFKERNDKKYKNHNVDIKKNNQQSD